MEWGAFLHLTALEGSVYQKGREFNPPCIIFPTHARHSSTREKCIGGSM